MDGRDEKDRFIKGYKGGTGRPKESISINDELRKLLATKDKQTSKKYVEVLAKKIFTDALKGNDRLIIELWEQMEGRAKQQIDVGGGTDNTMRIIIEGVDISKFPNGK